MLGLRRRKKAEGWALDIPGEDGEPEQASLSRRILDSNKAWLICLVGIILLTLFLMKNSNRTIGPKVPVVDPLKPPSAFRDRGRYARFETEFRADKRFADSIVNVRFLTPGKLRLVVRRETSADDIDYMAKIAAERVRHLFHHRTVVYVYETHPKNGARVLVATAMWQPAKHGYLVKFHNSAK